MKLRQFVLLLSVLMFLTGVQITWHKRTCQRRIQSASKPQLLTQLSEVELLHWHVESLYEIERRGFRNVRAATHFQATFQAERFEWKPMAGGHYLDIKCVTNYFPNGGYEVDCSHPTNGIPYRWNWWEVQTHDSNGWTTIAKHRY